MMDIIKINNDFSEYENYLKDMRKNPCVIPTSFLDYFGYQVIFYPETNKYSIIYKYIIGP